MHWTSRNQTISTAILGLKKVVICEFDDHARGNRSVEKEKQCAAQMIVYAENTSPIDGDDHQINIYAGQKELNKH
jgi:hypothetical protein